MGLMFHLTKARVERTGEGDLGFISLTPVHVGQLNNVVLKVSDLLDFSEARNLLILGTSGWGPVSLVFMSQWTLPVPEG